MCLLPADEDIARLYCFIDPETRFILAAQEAISRSRNLEHIPNSGHLNFKGWSFEYVPNKKDFPDGPGVEHASSWDKI